MDSQLHISNARLQEAHTEIRGLTGRQGLLQSRIEELEKLIEQLRAREFQSQALITNDQAADHSGMPALQVHHCSRMVSACCSYLCCF
jgi:chromosome segregation ATPase